MSRSWPKFGDNQRKYRDTKWKERTAELKHDVDVFEVCPTCEKLKDEFRTFLFNSKSMTTIAFYSYICDNTERWNKLLGGQPVAL